MSKQRTKVKCCKKPEVNNLDEKIKELTEIIDKVEDEKLDIENKMKKALADYSNLEKSIDKRLEIRLDEMKLKVARNLLEIMDDFYYAMEAGKNFNADECVTSWMSGISNSFEKMKKTLDVLGVEILEAKVGEKYDFGKHEAIGVVKEGKNDTIHEIIQPGYIMGENIVRPVRVIVSKIDK